jgi:hypothetical protein
VNQAVLVASCIERAASRFDWARAQIEAAAWWREQLERREIGSRKMVKA